MAVTYIIEGTYQEPGGRWYTIVEFTHTESGQTWRNSFNWNFNQPTTDQIDAVAIAYAQELQLQLTYPSDENKIEDGYKDEVKRYLQKAILWIKQNPTATQNQFNNYIKTQIDTDSLVELAGWSKWLMKSLYRRGLIAGLTWEALRDFIVNTPINILARVFPE